MTRGKAAGVVLTAGAVALWVSIADLRDILIVGGLATLTAACGVAVWWAGRPGRSRRGQGMASWWAIGRTSSPRAMRRRATVLRPSLAALSWWRRRLVPVLSYATPLCRARGRRVYTSCEESTLRIGIPGTGKTAELVCRVVDAPGGVVVTSTAADLWEMSASLRAARGPVAVFNPAGIGGIASTLRWSPLSGCTDPATATRRADDLIGPGSGSPEAQRWEAQARRALAVLLHAAALGGYRIADVAGWVAAPDRALPQVVDALMRSPRAIEMCRAAEQVIGMNPRTRDGVLLPVAAALAWVTLPEAAAVGDPDPNEAHWSPADLYDRNGALYLLGDDNGTVGPLVAALTAETAHQARQAAAVRPGGRLDPGLTFCLDEVALVCPTPLDRWMAELRKRSIVVHAACQGLGQLRQRWGDDGASMILNSAAAVLVFGGCKDADLDLFTRIAGDRDERVVTRDHNGHATRTVRRVPVLDAATLSALPNHRALLVRRGMPVVLARTPIGWKRRDIRRAARPDTNPLVTGMARAARPEPPATSPASSSLATSSAADHTPKPAPTSH